jgi:fatty acid desaturase
MAMSIRSFLTPEELKWFLEKSDWRGAWEVAYVWLWISAAFALVAWLPNPLTVVIALFILGGQQLACAIIMHDASHYSLFKSRRLNEWAGAWLGAYPIIHSLERYRPYHLKHHAHTGLEADPDLNLTKGYPTTSRSLFRKFRRDLTGATGLKGYIGLILMHLDLLAYNLAGNIQKLSQKDRSWSGFFSAAYHRLTGPVIANAALFAVVYGLSGVWWLYLLWPVAMLTTFQFSLRVRSMAEHSMSPDPTDPYKNTRTTYANFLEHLLFAPLYVNYHAEHHLLMGAPCYKYPKLHKLLVERGFYKQGLLAKGYAEIIRQAARPLSPVQPARSFPV